MIKQILRVAGIVLLFIAAFLLMGFGVMYLWNWLMPELFHLPVIDVYQAFGLVVLSKLLFGGIRVHTLQPMGKRRLWKAKWESMSEEERQQFKKDFAERCKSKWGHEPREAAKSS